MTAETVPFQYRPPVELETVTVEIAPPAKDAPPVGKDPPLQKQRSVREAMASMKLQKQRSVREAMASMKQPSGKEMKEKIQKAPRLFLQKSWEVLKDGHAILSLFCNDKSNFPRSDRVLVFLAYLMSQFFVIGLFRNSAVIQDQWVCPPAMSDASLWRVMESLNETDDLINGTAASSIIWVNGTASSISAKGWCDSQCGSNSTIKRNTKTSANVRGKKGGGRRGGGAQGEGTSTEILSPLEQQCSDFCDCASQPPELVYIISNAILVILLSGLPVTIMAVSFKVGYQKVGKADALSVNITLQKLEKVVDKFELQQANFAAIMGNTIFFGCFSAADTVHLLLLYFRGSLKILTAFETKKTEGKYHGVLNVLIDKKQRGYWADVLLMNLVAMMDDMSRTKKGQHSTLLDTTEFLLDLEIMRESYKHMRSIVVGNAEAARNMDQVHNNVKVANKNKRMGWTMITLGYFLAISYILVCTWFVMTYTLQYGPEDTTLWLGGFFNTFTLDIFLISPLQIVLKSVFLLPLVAYLTPSLEDMADNMFESQGNVIAFATGLFEMC